MKLEVILGAYNDSDVLNVVLQGYMNQNDSDFSICIADDGSGPEIRKLVEKFSNLGLDIRHVWQEDDGFRKSIILNKAIATSQADRIIFSDGDCIPNPYFIHDHRVLAHPSKITAGPRVMLNKKLTDDLKNGSKEISYLYNTFKLLFLSLFKQLSKPEQIFRFPSLILPLTKKIKRIGPYGANMAISREALLKVNGFDEDYLGWGGEDTDLVIRLNMLGIKSDGYIGRAALYHMYHPSRAVDDGDKERATLKKNKEENRVLSCTNGLDKYLT
ncbi:glycosyltransferase [Vibrio sp. Of7-15]|uniref:galactosyltransferase-related protein n=1 Tax=Vibrio sp. Of7-15 TaxID=2724879 RepID=UPI001EF20524|nr:galactosyltransferase-related protein [Vibrio sp. Of7-15]MCG7496821.1 glycosyltransferase [Vibrio sp. Of7-15]